MFNPFDYIEIESSPQTNVFPLVVKVDTLHQYDVSIKFISTCTVICPNKQVEYICMLCILK